MGLVLLRRCEDKACEVAEPLSRRSAQSEGALHGLVDRRVGTPLGAACPIDFLSDLLADFWQVVLTVGLLDMRQEFRAFAHEVCAAAQ